MYVRRAIEQIEQLRSTSDQIVQKAEWYAARNDPKLARLLRDMAVATNRFRAELERRQEGLAKTREQRALDALERARRAGKVEDAEFADVA